MPLNISFGDYDTVCYSNQYNIIQLIKHSIGIAINVDMNSANIDSMGQDIVKLINDLKELYDKLYASGGAEGTGPGDVGELQQLMDIVRDQVNTLKTRVDGIDVSLQDMLNYRPNFINKTTLGGIIQQYGERITALEGG